MLTMGGIAEFERGLIRKRCEEGIERAKRRRTSSTHGHDEMRLLWQRPSLP
jgi:DNA invertase Pin-like site-specific DNA recombinase